MSDMYFPDDTLQELDARETVKMTKAHQVRNCAACGGPIIDEKAESLPIGGGLSLKIHRTCMNQLVEATQPVTVTIPVPVTKPSTVTRKSTYAPYDQDRMAASIKREMYQLLLDEGMRQRR